MVFGTELGIDRGFEMRRQAETKVVRQYLAAVDDRSRNLAWAQVQKMFEPMVRSQIRNLFGSKIDESTVDDLSQETFFGVFGSIDKFDWSHPETFGAWLLGIAKKKAIDLSRKRIGRKGNSNYGVVKEVYSEDLSPVNGEPSRVIATEQTPEDLLMENERTKGLLMALRGLTERDQQVVIMRSVLGLTLKKIGQVLGVSEARVSQLYRASEDLMKKRLDDSPAGATTFDKVKFDVLVESVRAQAESVLGAEIVEEDSIAAK